MKPVRYFLKVIRLQSVGAGMGLSDHDTHMCSYIDFTLC